MTFDLDLILDFFRPKTSVAQDATKQSATERVEIMASTIENQGTKNK